MWMDVKWHRGPDRPARQVHGTQQRVGPSSSGKRARGKAARPRRECLTPSRASTRVVGGRPAQLSDGYVPGYGCHSRRRHTWPRPMQMPGSWVEAGDLQRCAQASLAARRPTIVAQSPRPSLTSPVLDACRASSRAPACCGCDRRLARIRCSADAIPHDGGIENAMKARSRARSSSLLQPQPSTTSRSSYHTAVTYSPTHYTLP